MKKTIIEYNINNKTVLIRCDLNVPIKNGVITDDSRIKASLKTINYCLDNNAKVIILSHLGKVKTVEDKEKLSLYPVSIRLQELLNREVLFSKDTRSNNLTSLAKNLKEGQILSTIITLGYDANPIETVKQRKDFDKVVSLESLGNRF